METQLLFLMKSVKMSNQKRYQSWFTQSFLSTAESECWLVDIVRFICSCFHPTNEILSSDITPRWAVIGWLFKSVRSHTVSANFKLSLFYDWLFFEHHDNIMNIGKKKIMIHFFFFFDNFKLFWVINFFFFDFYSFYFSFF